MKTIQPQELEVWYLLPAIRKELAKAMKEKGATQKVIAEALQVTPAAVSQYMNEKRATTTIFDNTVKEQIKISAENLTKHPEKIREETQIIIKQSRNQRLVCQLCHTYSQTPKECEVCFQ